MKKMTDDVAVQFSSRPGVRGIAVDNFLLSLSGVRADDEANVELDARLYKWNAATVRAIRDGIAWVYGK